MTAAPLVWTAAVLAVFGIGAIAGIIDYDLWGMYGVKGTITAWLRLHWLAAAAPMVLVQIFLIWLTGHLAWHWPPEGEPPHPVSVEQPLDFPE